MAAAFKSYLTPVQDSQFAWIHSQIFSAQYAPLSTLKATLMWSPMLTGFFGRVRRSLRFCMESTNEKARRVTRHEAGFRTVGWM
jgi:hypothetical protein